jgi:hypothetical protein
MVPSTRPAYGSCSKFFKGRNERDNLRVMGQPRFIPRPGLRAAPRIRGRRLR